MAAQSRGSVNVLVQPPNDSFEAIATLFFSSRSVRTWKRGWLFLIHSQLARVWMVAGPMLGLASKAKLVAFQQGLPRVDGEALDHLAVDQDDETAAAADAVFDLTFRCAVVGP